MTLTILLGADPMKADSIRRELATMHSSSDPWFQCGPSGGYVEQLTTGQLWDLMGVRSNIFDNDPADIISDYECWALSGEDESFL